MSDSMHGKGAVRSPHRRSFPWWKKILWPLLRTTIGRRVVELAWGAHEKRYWQRHPALAITLPRDVLRFQPQVYDGERMKLLPNVVLNPGSAIIEVHANNMVVRQLKIESVGDKEISEYVLEDLAAFATSFDTIKLHSYTALRMHSMHAAFMKRAGFTLFACPETKRTAFERFFAEGMILLYRLEDRPPLRRQIGTFYDGFLSVEESLTRFATPPVLK